MKKCILGLVLGVAVLCASSRSQAAPCPGTAIYASANIGARLGMGTVTKAFVMTGANNCVAVPTGTVFKNCNQNYSSSLMQVSFIAAWIGTPTRLADTMGGCHFICPGGDCYVRNNGLPVELLNFGVD